MDSTKYPKAVLEAAIKESKTLAEVFRKLGKRWSGGQQQNLKRWIARYGIDTSHFLGMAANRGKTPVNKRHWQEILVLNESLDWRIKSSVLRHALIQSGRSYVCEDCGQDENWRGKKITLQVEHKNRNWKDNQPANLMFLCPNCHAGTDGWSGKKD